MKKLTLASIFLFLLAACEFAVYTGNTSKVRDGTFDIDKTKTIGSAFDHWQACKEKTWDEPKSENNNVVEFTCVHNIEPYFQRLRAIRLEHADTKKMDSFLDLKSFSQIFQFIVNKDDDRLNVRSRIEIEWVDGSTNTKLVDTMKFIPLVYSNELAFDPKKLSDMGSTESLSKFLYDFYQSAKRK